jgi:hypothetical protein
VTLSKNNPTVFSSNILTSLDAKPNVWNVGSVPFLSFLVVYSTVECRLFDFEDNVYLYNYGLSSLDGVLLQIVPNSDLGDVFQLIAV